jgi:Uma2 family endonuclease
MTTITIPPTGPASAAPTAPILTLADLMERLGGVPLERIRFTPSVGSAVEQDVLHAAKDGHLCELVDGVLVEKTMRLRESLLAMALGHILRAFILPRNLGLVAGEQGALRLFAGLVRIPDVSFISWDRLPNRRVPEEPIPHLAPDLAVEVLSESNTSDEMARKRREYFSAGVRLVWMADPNSRTVDVYTNENQFTRLTIHDLLDGGVVLPGFQLPLQEWFAELDRQG